MADPGFEAFFWAISTQESGGNYNAVGPQTKYGRAYGKYQVLETNIWRWTSQYYGRALSREEFLANPKAQEAVARGKLQEYYNRYGAKGAAAMWYSGQPDPNKTFGNPPVYKYVNSVMGHASRYSGGSSATAYSGGGATVPVAQPQLTDDERAEQYGLSMRLINSSKELKRLFQQAVAGSWSAGRFAASLKNTGWWRNQSDTLRKYITLKITDPATWRQEQGSTIAKLNNLAIQVGLGNQIVKGKPTALLQKVTYWQQALGWTDARIKNYLGDHVGVHGGMMWGEAGEAYDKLHELAYANGMRYSQSWYAKQARDLVAGRTTLERSESYIRSQAAARYSTFAEQIKAGVNAMDLAAPYIKTMSEILELPETDIDLFTKHIQNAMTGKEAGFSYPMWKFEQDLRADPLWRKTNGARESMFSVAHQVAKDFGVAY